ncbi:plasmid mobilization relaxosome protein MobC [Rhizobium ruizarguesonis]
MRNRNIRIRCTEAEATTMKNLAKSRGLSLSDMVRRAAFGVRMPPRTFDATQAALLAQTLGELGRIGGNVNQLARRANAGTFSGHDAELAATLAGIDTLRERIRTMLS